MCDPADVAMVCRVCRSPTRAVIDRALVAGQWSLRELAAQHGLSASAMHRHRRTCLPEDLVHAVVQVQALDAEGCLLEVDRLRRRADRVLDQALEVGDHRTALQAMTQCRSALELLVRTRLAQAATVSGGPGPRECCYAYAREYVGNMLTHALVRDGPLPPPAPDEPAD